MNSGLEQGLDWYLQCFCEPRAENGGGRCDSAAGERGREDINYVTTNPAAQRKAMRAVLEVGSSDDIERETGGRAEFVNKRVVQTRRREIRSYRALSHAARHRRANGV